MYAKTSILVAIAGIISGVFRIWELYKENHAYYIDPGYDHTYDGSELDYFHHNYSQYLTPILVISVMLIVIIFYALKKYRYGNDISLRLLIAAIILALINYNAVVIFLMIGVFLGGGIG